MSTAIRQLATPKIDIPAQRGWCLKYVDDAVDAPSRKPSAQASYDTEYSHGNIRVSQFPVGIWVPAYLRLTKGANKNLGHVFWAYNHGNGDVEIHDSEVHSGARQPYHSLAELLAWFGAQAPQFIGWSYWIDGVHVCEEYTVPDPEPTPEPETPSYTVKDGDTLGQIILDQGWGTPETLWGEGGDVERVAKANGIANPDLIYPGQVIKKA